MRRAWVPAFCVAALACGGEIQPITGCEARGSVAPVCGFRNPEDLAVLPSGDALVVSQLGAMDGSRAGSLAIFPLGAGGPRIAWKGGEEVDVASAAPAGDTDCPGPPPPGFSPHGIDLVERLDGTLGLLVVNHGGREAVELFEVRGTGATAELEWRGCAVPPEGTFMNDVAALPGGGFAVTHMFPKSGSVGTMAYVLASMIGFSSGHALEWRPGAGFREIPGTEAPFPNGIEASPDGKFLYLNAYMANEVRKIDRETGEVVARAEVHHPDNISWNADGSRLLVASQTGGFTEMMGCAEIESGACPAPYQIVALDPGSMTSEVLYESGDDPMGAATVAVEAGGSLWVGTFAGDRVARITPLL